MIHEIKGPGTLVPPRVIYQSQDIRPVVLGDFDADTDVDVRDFWWFQFCFDSNIFFLPFGCNQLDFDGDGNVFFDDLHEFQDLLLGPGLSAADLQTP